MGSERISGFVGWLTFCMEQVKNKKKTNDNDVRMGVRKHDILGKFVQQ